jgi:hypothetical protein
MFKMMRQRMLDKDARFKTILQWKRLSVITDYDINRFMQSIGQRHMYIF